MKGAVRMNREVNPWWRWLRESIRYGLRKSSKPMPYAGVIQNFIQAKEFKKYYLQVAKQASEIDVQKSMRIFLCTCSLN